MEATKQQTSTSICKYSRLLGTYLSVLSLLDIAESAVIHKQHTDHTATAIARSKSLRNPWLAPGSELLQEQVHVNLVNPSYTVCVCVCVCVY